MSCYHPILGIPDYEKSLNDSGKRSYKLVGTYDPIAKQLDPNVVAIPCGRCVGCRLDYSRAWADRMMLELEHTGKAVFVTLTYNNENVPICENADTGEFTWFSLYKRDLQLFFKRLRKHFDKDIRYYASGEYGENTHRPHYHAIIFGLGLEDFDLKLHCMNELKQPVYESKLLERIWSNGYVTICEVSWQTCAYVARYVMKKVYAGDQAIIENLGIEKEFAVMSRRPGIGAYYMQDHPELFDVSQIFVKGKPDGIRIPKYFLKKLAIENKEKYDKIMSERRKFNDDRVFLKMQQTDLSYIEQLEVEENAKLMKTNTLKRVL